jgi:hypothetical protein
MLVLYSKMRWWRARLGVQRLQRKHSFDASGSSAFSPANAERSTVAIDPSRSFLIVRLRSVEMHNTVEGCLWHCSKDVYGTVTRARSEPPDLDRVTERGLNVGYCSYGTQIQRTPSLFDMHVWPLNNRILSNYMKKNH